MQLLVGDIFRQAAGAVPDRMAAALGDSSLTFGALQELATDVANRLSAVDVGPGDRVVVWSATSLDVVPVYVACAQIGAVFCPMSPLFTADEATALLEVAAPTAVLTDGERSALCADLDLGEQIVTATLDPLGPAGDAALPRLAERAGPTPGAAPAPELLETDPHVVFFTSGSTGRPKGVVISHRASFLRSHPGSQLEPRGRAVCMYPMFHMAPWTISLQQWHARDGVVFVEAATAEAICDAVTRHGAERLNAIPAVWQRLLDHLASDATRGDELDGIRFADTGTSATPPALMAAMKAALPTANIRIFYGSTEAGNVAALDHVDIERKPGSIGVASVSNDLRVDESGEMWARSPVLFDGYLNQPDATAEVLVDGWYRTGDLAEVDADGYWSIVGRARDVIRSGGETVAPSEVELVLADHPDLVDVAVVGLPDDRWGEVVCAVVVARRGADVGLEDLRRHCEGRLAPYKQPRRAVTTAEIPRTASTSQVQRKLLVEQLLSGVLG